MTPLVEEMIAAHGGEERWRAASAVAVVVSTGGLAFRSRLRSPLRHREGRVATGGQRTVVDAYPRPGRRGVFDAGTVRIEDDDGTVVAARPNARAAFRHPRRLVRWDALDFLYFAGYALWTYVSLPFVLTDPGYDCHEIASGDGVRRLAVTFPEGVHTHSREQILHVDDSGFIRRHDYTAEPFGRWARAAHGLGDYREFDGLMAATRRRVVPRGPGGRPLPGPTLVWIHMHDLRRLASPS